MTPEQITRGLYDWLTATSRIDNMPMGMRPCTWDELQHDDPDLAARWRIGIDMFLDAIGARPDAEPHLNFIGSIVVKDAPLAGDDDPGDEHRITPDDG